LRNTYARDIIYRTRGFYFICRALLTTETDTNIKDAREIIKAATTKQQLAQVETGSAMWLFEVR